MPKLMVKRYAADVEQLLLAHKYGFKIAECPVQINYNKAGDNIGIQDIYNIGYDTAAVYYRAYILKYYDNAGNMPHIIDNKSRSIVLENFSK